MNVWLINSSEMVPTDPGNLRLRRTGILADVLLSRGHRVLWWTSTFRHLLKVQRFAKDTVVDLTDHFRLRFLRVPAYRRNVSVSRLWNHHLLGRKFKQLAPAEARPDVILCSFPTVELSVEAVRFGAAAGVPVVLDIRDMWPDIFLDLVPRPARGPASLVLRPVFKAAAEACRGAFAISGHAPAFVEWGLRRGQRQQGRFDRDFPFAYAVPQFDEATLAEARQFWRDHGVPAHPDTTIVCFVGTINYQFDLETVIRAARRLGTSADIQFVLAGAGLNLDRYQKLAADCPNVLLPGLVDAPQVQTLMQMSHLALAPYLDRLDFQESISNKAIEYLSGGLPVLTSLHRGILVEMLREQRCGIHYADEDQLARILRQISASREKLKEISDNARRLFSEHFVAAEVYGAMADYLEEVAAAGRISHRSTAGAEPS